MPKRTNDGVKKRCAHSRRSWRDCACPWWFGFHHGGREYRYSLTKLVASRGEAAPTSKDAAIVWRDRLRVEIRSGTFIDPEAVSAPITAADTRLTLGDVADQYLAKHVRQDGRRDAGRKLMEWYVAALRRAEIPAANGTRVCLEQKPIEAITTADVDAIRDGWTRRSGAAKGGRVGVDRALKRLRHLFNWAIEKGYVDHTPFKRHGVTLVHFAKDQARIRRLEPGEENRLLQHAPAFLLALITAALETGCRLGELLGLRWRDVKPEAGVLLLPGEITKTGEPRDVPMTQRLMAVLELRKHAPDGTEHPPEACVFGNEVGERIACIRNVWQATCTAAKVTGLHFHDLRREFASRLRETPGISDHHVRDWLGHADMATTSRYLATTRVGLQHARLAFEQHRAGFAHYSHTPAVQTPSDRAVQMSQNPGNSLN